jgi:hypothetical protein
VLGALEAGLEGHPVEVGASEGVLVFGTRATRRPRPDEYRQPLTGAFPDAKRLWSVESSDIRLISVHGGTVLQDRARLTRLLVVSMQWRAVSTSPFYSERAQGHDLGRDPCNRSRMLSSQAPTNVLSCRDGSAIYGAGSSDADVLSHQQQPQQRPGRSHRGGCKHRADFTVSALVTSSTGR